MKEEAKKGRKTERRGVLGDVYSKWYRRIRRWEEAHIGRKIMAVGLPGKRRSGRPMRRYYMKAPKEDMIEAGVVPEEHAENRRAWRLKKDDPL